MRKPEEASGAESATPPPKASLAVVLGAEVEVLDRAAVQLAAYNPRKMSPEQRARLAHSLRTYGLAELPVWNKRTGNLVAGHQRLKELDEQYPDGYRFRATVVDLPLEKEKALNVMLNNRQAQGDWDYGLLAQLLNETRSAGLEALDTGFDDSEVDKLLEAGAAASFDIKEEEGAPSFASGDSGLPPLDNGGVVGDTQDDLMRRPLTFWFDNEAEHDEASVFFAAEFGKGDSKKLLALIRGEDEDAADDAAADA